MPTQEAYRIPAAQDSEWLEALRQGAIAGDEAAQDEFLSHLLPIINRYASSSVTALRDREEVVQAILIKAYDHMLTPTDESGSTKFEGGGVRSWIGRTVATSHIDLRRRNSRYTLGLDGDFYEELSNQPSSEQTEVRALNEGNPHRLRELAELSGCSEQQGKIILALYEERLTCLQIAQQMSISEGTVKSSASRARDKIKFYLAEQGARSVSEALELV